MSLRDVAMDITRAPRRALRVLTRPVRAARSRGDVALQPYRGYGSREEIFLIGRVFRQPAAGPPPSEATAGRDALDLGRRLLRRGIPDAELVARYCGAERRVATDRDGYFRVRLRPMHPPPADRLWHAVELELLGPAPFKAEGEVFVPSEACRRVVISDIDDTVMRTGVANKAVMLWRLFAQGAESRVAFPGVAAFFRALHAGASEAEGNPMLYVSRAPWGNYEVLEEFFRLQGIPVGPLLFLREWGLSLQSPLPRRGKGHKLELIRNMLALYRDLPFVLLGDSGQRDPEIYARVVRENPGRVQAVYIRNLGRDPERVRAIEALAVEVAEAGSALVLAADSFAMAEHAAALGLIAPEALAEVVRERRTEEGEGAGLEPIRQVGPGSPGGAREAVERGELRDALGSGEDDGAPPSVVVGTGTPAPCSPPVGDPDDPRPGMAREGGHPAPSRPGATTMGVFSKDIKSMDDLFVHTLQDIYYAENQIVKSLPKMIEKASSPELKQAFTDHLSETKVQVQRLEEVFKMHGQPVKGVTCAAMDGILNEAEEIMGEVADQEVLDAAMLSAAQAVEHYEITRYGTLVAWAKQLGRPDCAGVLEQNLAEEKATDGKLTRLAEAAVNRRAAA